MGRALKTAARDIGVQLVERHGACLVRGEDALEIIDALERDNIRITGMEGFAVEGRLITPYMDAIGDFTKVMTAKESAHQARLFIVDTRREGIVYDFSLREAED